MRPPSGGHEGKWATLVIGVTGYTSLGVHTSSFLCTSAWDPFVCLMPALVPAPTSYFSQKRRQWPWAGQEARFISFIFSLPSLPCRSLLSKRTLVLCEQRSRGALSKQHVAGGNLIRPRCMPSKLSLYQQARAAYETRSTSRQAAALLPRWRASRRSACARACVVVVVVMVRGGGHGSSA